jgi:hypothetical protein
VGELVAKVAQVEAKKDKPFLVARILTSGPVYLGRNYRRKEVASLVTKL